MGKKSLDIKEELQALKKSVGSCRDEIVNCNDEIANLMAKNANLEAKNSELEARNHDVEQAISELQKLVGHGDVDMKEVDDEDLIAMNTNAYTMLYTSPIRSAPFVAGFVPCLIQYSVFSLFLLDLLQTTSIPPGVTTLVRICQVVAISIAFLVETDMLQALRAVVYSEGFDKMANVFIGFDPLKFYASNALMGVQGLLGKIVAFFLIVIADNVFDLLLNFTAIMFVSELDEIVFFLARHAYIGSNAEKVARKIEKTQLPPSHPKGIFSYLHIFLYGVAMTAAIIAFAIIGTRQDSQESLADFVKVQFGDEVDPTLGLFSGCYEKRQTDGWDARVRYVQAQAARGQGDFEYCRQDGLQTWVFANETSKTACDGKFMLRSAEERSTSFDLLDAKGDQWLLAGGNQISEFRLGEINPGRFEIECGEIAVGGSGTTEELCPFLTVDTDATRFSGSQDWSRTYLMLEDSNGEIVQFYQHPVFVGESPGRAGYVIIFFTGRRWVLASAAKLLGKKQLSFENVVSLFGSSDFWLLRLPEDALDYLSETVSQANDRGTPLGLRWFYARYAEGVAFPFADISRPGYASLQCGKCNRRTNPCLYEGICEADGTCTCSHGASGQLCEIKPLGDGVCNLFFNTEAYQFDGGDC